MTPTDAFPAETDAEDGLDELLDHLLAAIQTDAIVESDIDQLVTALADRQARLMPEEWTRSCRQVQRHEVHAHLLSDPLSRRSFERPRGYPGDAVMIDLVYQHRSVAQLARQAPRLGQMILSLVLEQPIARGVRERRSRMALAIDDACRRVQKPEMLAIACGHAREVELSEGVRSGAIGRMVGLDQDAESLFVAREVLPTMTCLHQGVESLLDDACDIGSYDLIYSAGLYDYLSMPSAQRLTRALFKMLKPGGELIIANVREGNVLRAYMESVMNWPLIYRTQQDVERFAERLPGQHVAKQTCWCDDSGAIVMTELIRSDTRA